VLADQTDNIEISGLSNKDISDLCVGILTVPHIDSDA